MIKKSGNWWLVIIIYLASFVVCNLYDYWGIAYDGSIRGFQYNRILLLAGAFVSLIMLLVLGVKSRKSLIQNISLSLISLVVMFSLMEIVSWIFIGTGMIAAEKPRHHLFNSGKDIYLSRMPFWGDFNADFAKWRLPHDTLTRHVCSGQSIFFQTNSYGARDKERMLKSAKGKRALFLGDSFVEGYMVDADKRASELLEIQTGLEHLNFGINGTSPINYYLTYKHLAKKFDHDVVVVGLLPANDFEDFTEEKMLGLVNDPIYRPYWKLGTKPYQLCYSLDSIGMSENSTYMVRHPREIHKTITSVFKNYTLKGKVMSFLQDNSYTFHMVRSLIARTFTKTAADPSYSRFNSYTEDEWKIFSHSLESLFQESKGKAVIVLLFPITNEVKAYSISKKSRLPKEVKEIGDRYGATTIDLLPHFVKQQNWENLYVPCDGHLSERGEKLVSEIIYNHPVYRHAIGLE